MRNIFFYTFLFIILCLLQILVFNNFNFFGRINPQVYIIFILVIPNIKTYILFLLAFFMGIAIDIFSGTGGIHSSSLLFLAAFRHPLLRRINLKTIDDEYKLDNLSVFNRSLFFAIICIFHSLLIHFFNTVNFKNALDTVVNSLLDAFLTWVFVLLIFPWVQFPTKKEEFGAYQSR